MLGKSRTVPCQKRGRLLHRSLTPPRGTFTTFVFGRKAQAKIRALFGQEHFYVLHQL
jgi:hypothetical protein